MKKKKFNIIRKEIEMVVELEKEELKEFNVLSKTILTDIKKTKQELKLEEQVRLNLEFVHYKLEEIRDLVQDILHMHNRLKKEESVIHEINHAIKYILKVVTQLENEFFPALNQKLQLILENKKVTKIMKQRFSRYKEIVDKLKKILNIEDMSARGINRISDQRLLRVKTKIS